MVKENVTKKASASLCPRYLCCPHSFCDQASTQWFWQMHRCMHGDVMGQKYCSDVDDEP